MAARRIAKELADAKSNPVPGVWLHSGAIDADLFNWKGSMLGPEGSPYEDGLFVVELKLPRDYPFKPPRVNFLTKIYHPNINQRGMYCLEYTGDSWHPMNKLLGVMQAIQEKLKSPTPDDPLVPEIAIEYKRDYTSFAHTAESWTALYAK